MDHIVLQHGAHKSRDHGVCLMEAVAWFAGEKHSDSPTCACPVLASFGRRLNDRLDDTHRQELKDLIPAMSLSRASRAVTIKRAYVAADFAVRRFAPVALDLSGFGYHAARLRALTPIVDVLTAKAAHKESRVAADAVDAAINAADADAAAAAAYAAADAAANAADAADAAAYADADAAAAAAYAADAYAADASAADASAAAAVKQDVLLREGRACLEAMLAVVD